MLAVRSRKMAYVMLSILLAIGFLNATLWSGIVIGAWLCRFYMVGVRDRSEYNFVIMIIVLCIANIVPSANAIGPLITLAAITTVWRLS